MLIPASCAYSNGFSIPKYIPAFKAVCCGFVFYFHRFVYNKSSLILKDSILNTNKENFHHNNLLISFCGVYQDEIQNVQ